MRQQDTQQDKQQVRTLRALIAADIAATDTASIASGNHAVSLRALVQRASAALAAPA